MVSHKKYLSNGILCVVFGSIVTVFFPTGVKGVRSSKRERFSGRFGQCGGFQIKQPRFEL